MTISPEIVNLLLGTILAAMGWFLKTLGTSLKDHGERLKVLETKTPTPEMLQNSVAGIGSRVGELESKSSVHNSMLNTFSDMLQEFRSEHKEERLMFANINETLSEVKERLARIEAHLDKDK